jgi:hypothetical protein
MLNKKSKGKRIPTATLLLMLLISVLLGGLLASVGAANPMGALLPHDPQAMISVKSPVNQKTYNACAVTVNFSVDLHEWIPPWPKYNPAYSFSSRIMCILDEHYVPWQETVMNLPQIHDFSILLKGLSNGFHNLRIRVVTDGSYWHGTYHSDPLWGGTYWEESNIPIHLSSYLSFEIAANPPELDILSLKQQETYDTTDLPLDFAVSTPVSWMAYSLDGQDNVVITENTTLAGLSGGKHNVTVYAKDNARTLGAPETVTFIVTQEALSEVEQDSTLFPAAFAAVGILTAVVTVGSGLLRYFKKRKH